MPSDRTDTFDEAVALAAARLIREQADINAALVQRIVRCEGAEKALQASENRLHALLADQLKRREEERRRVALEIHDSLGQNLLALRLDVAALHGHTTTRQARLHGWVSAALNNLDDAILSAQQLIDELRPFQLELGLQAVVEWEIQNFTHRHGIACNVSGLDALEDLVIDDTQLLSLFRVLQECLHNIARHARASVVDIAVHAWGDRVSMQIVDNGIGIDPDRPPVSALSLMGMRERLHGVGGTFTIIPACPHGTDIMVTVPLSTRK